MPLLIRAASLSLLVFLSGCASMGGHGEGPRPDVYSGVRADVYNATHPSDAPHPVLSAVDLPFSFVWDTLCLPIDVTALCLETHYKHVHKKDDKTPNHALEPTATAPSVSTNK